ncbi:MAG: hypothetical protein M0Z39_08385 [Actinomycetota bacterium]|jgi:hypothetical protein|nr:hypothetical protein [Actinomycetota bacterium]
MPDEGTRLVNKCHEMTQFEWSEPSDRGTLNGKSYTYYQHVAGDCLYTLFEYDDPDTASELEMSNMKGRDCLLVIVKGKDHAGRIIRVIEDME